MTTSINTDKWATGSRRYLLDADAGNGAGAAGQPPPPQPPPPPQGQQAQPPVPPQQPPPPAQDTDEDKQYKRQGRNRIIPEDAFKRIKQDAEARGARRAQEALAKEMGYASVEAMKAAQQERQRGNGHNRDEGAPDEREDHRQQPPKNGQGQPGQQTRSDRRDAQKWERERERLVREKDTLARRMAQEARARKALQADLDAKDAEMSLRETAAMSGVKDIDYAVRLLKRHIDGLDDKTLDAFDEAKWFEGLRGEKPYLFGEVERKANSGTGAGQPPPPKPGAAADNQRQGDKIDARKMSKEEYAEHLRKRGLSTDM